MDLGRDNIVKLIFYHSVPATVGMLVNAVYNLADRIFIGYAVGAEAFSSMSVASAVFLVLQAFGTWIGIGAASLIAIKMGEKRPQRVEELIGGALVTLATTSAVVFLGVSAFLDDVLYFFGASGSTIPYGREYLIVIACGLPFMITGTGLYHINRVIGYPTEAMLFTAVSALLNVLLDFVFLFPFDMGIGGAALATVISQFILLLCLLRLLLKKTTAYGVRLKNLKLRYRDALDIYRAGLSTFFTQVVSSLIAAAANNQLLRYENYFAVGAYGAINITYSAVLMPVFGIGQGSQPIIGYNYGAKFYARAREALYKSLLLAFLIGIGGWLLFHLQSVEVMSAITNGDGRIMSYAADGLEKLTLLFPLATVQAVGQVYFQSIGKPKKTLLLSVLHQTVFLIPMLYILPQFWGTDGVWYAIPVAEFLSLLCTGSFIAVENYRMRKYLG